MRGPSVSADEGDAERVPGTGRPVASAEDARRRGERTGRQPESSRAILFTLDGEDGPAIGYDANTGRFVQLGKPPGLPLRLSSTLAGVGSGTSSPASSDDPPPDR